MKAIVTGANGFIGKALVGELEKRGYEVEKVTFVLKCSDQSQFRADFLFHCADRHYSNKVGEFHSNISITQQVLEMWRAYQPQATFIGFDSIWAYPEHVDHGYKYLTTADYWNGALRPEQASYGIIKKLLHVGLREYNRQYGMKSCMMTLGNVYGPGDTSDRIIPTLFNKMLSRDKNIHIPGIMNKRDFTYIDDQVFNIVQAAEENISPIGHVHVGSGRYETLLLTACDIAEVTGYSKSLLQDIDYIVTDLQHINCIVTDGRVIHTNPTRTSMHNRHVSTGLYESKDWYKSQWELKHKYD